MEPPDSGLEIQISAGRGRARDALLQRAVAAAGARSQLPIDRIEVALMILDALLADPRVCDAAEVHLVLTARPGSLSMLVGPLDGLEAERLLGAASPPSAGPVVEHLASHACTVDDGSHLLVVVDGP